VAAHTEATLDNDMLLVTLEILIVIVAPLLTLYLTGSWPMRIVIPCLLVIPILWYVTYAPIHELGHVLGTYLVGGTVTEVKLIPSFWHGEFGRAWITPQGLQARWQQLVMTGAPYILDGLSVAIGFLVLRGKLLRRPFVLGVALMLLCLRPAFDVVCETVAFALGGRGDLYHIAQVTGYPVVWLTIVLLMGFSVFAVARVLVSSASGGTSAAT
jgi:hypothetical protein